MQCPSKNALWKRILVRPIETTKHVCRDGYDCPDANPTHSHGLARGLTPKCSRPASRLMATVSPDFKGSNRHPVLCEEMCTPAWRFCLVCRSSGQAGAAGPPCHVG